MTLKDDEAWSLIIEDAHFENTSGDAVDLAFATGAGYLNLQGIGKSERSAKVDRYQEILEHLASLKPPTPLQPNSSERS